MIEIIVVLLIIGILAAVAVAKFVRLIEDSQEMALLGGVAAGQSECSLTYGKLCLQNGTAPDCAEIRDKVRPVAGDIIVTFEEGAVANEIKITASHADWTPTVSGVWTRP